MSAVLWQRHPFIRIVVPFLAGIILVRALFSLVVPSVSLVNCLAALVLLSGFALFILRDKAQRAWGFVLSLFFLLFAAWRTAQSSLQIPYSPPASPVSAVAVLTSPQSVGDKTISFRAILTQAPNLPEGSTADILIYLPLTQHFRDLLPGDSLFFNASLQPLKNYRNPCEFDYADYLKSQGIAARVFLSDDNISDIKPYRPRPGRISLLSNLRLRALRLRAILLRRAAAAGLHDEPLALFAAVAAGDKSLLSSPLKNLYSQTGVRHLLALSGMHLGFLTFFLTLIAVRLCRRAWPRAVAVTFILLFVWMYALFAGLPVSLCRAALMYSLMLAGSLLRRSGFSVNSLCVAAFVMLSARPALLFDASFQLSFASMLGILLLFPKYQSILYKRNRVVKWIFGSLLVSLAAQLFSLPISACRFAVVPPYSAVSTLLVSPFTALLIILSPLFFISVSFDWATNLSVAAVSFLVNTQNAILSALARLPFTLIRTDWSPWFSLLCYAALAAVFFLRFKKKIHECAKLSLVLFIFVIALAVNNRLNLIRPQIVFYNNPACPAAHVILSPSASYLYPLVRSDSALQSLSYIAGSFWVRKLKTAPRLVSADYRDDAVSARLGLVHCKQGPSFLLLCDNFWGNKTAKTPLQIDYLWICRGFNSSLDRITQTFRPRLVVLDASLYNLRREALKEECAALGLPFYDVDADGALCVDLE